MIKSCIALAALVITVAAGRAAAPGLEPEPPAGPMMIYANVGACAGKNDRIELSLMHILSHDERVSMISLEDKAMAGGKIWVNPTRAPELADELERAAEQARRRQSLTATAAEVQLETAAEGKGWVVRMRGGMKRERGILESSTITVDADNAEALARILRRGHRNALWLAPHIDHIESELTDHAD